MNTNELIHESSPYLLQHAHNPVHWYPWGDTALLKARHENKMLLISVGYAACHWCHVMEHESYEDTTVAAIMNQYFVCIKVDREERPDVDQVYMNAAYLINGNGGWPLNAFAMPDGRPFFAGTYFPRDKWIQLLEYFADLYKNKRQGLDEQADHVSKGIREIENVPRNDKDVTFSPSTLDTMFSTLAQRVDRTKGGTVGAMKFPMPSIWEFLLIYHYRSKHPLALSLVETTLHQMARGGIYDQVGGGFSRYSTDPNWHAPHFEKMLYDNAQLVSLYSHAFQVTKNPLYQRIVYETIAFVERELTSPDGGFYSSLDADSEGEEGKYYVWTAIELERILGSDAPLFADYFGITAEGNWEPDKNIPDVNFGIAGITATYQLTENQLSERIAELSRKVLLERQKRVRPQTDDKILTAWNALMAKGLLDAYQAFGERSFLQMAATAIDFLLSKMGATQGTLCRNYKNGKATIPGFLDDYAFLITALIQYYQVTFDEVFLQKARELTGYVNRHFLDTSSGMYFYTDDQYSELIARKMEVADNVISASNSEMAKNIWLLSLYFENSDYEKQAEQLVKNISDDMMKNPGYYSNWAQALAMQITPVYEVAVAGENWAPLLADLQRHFLPHSIFLGGTDEGLLPLTQKKIVPGQSLIYVCTNKTCQLPVTEVQEALQQMK